MCPTCGWPNVTQFGNYLWVHFRYQQDFQHVYRNVVFAVGNEKASEAGDLTTASAQLRTLSRVGSTVRPLCASLLHTLRQNLWGDPVRVSGRLALNHHKHNHHDHHSHNQSYFFQFNCNMKPFYVPLLRLVVELPRCFHHHGFWSLGQLVQEWPSNVRC